MTFLLTPSSNSLFIRVVWSTRSNALEQSMVIAVVAKPLSVLLNASLVSFIRQLVVLLPLAFPNWVGSLSDSFVSCSISEMIIFFYDLATNWSFGDRLQVCEGFWRIFLGDRYNLRDFKCIWKYASCKEKLVILRNGKTSSATNSGTICLRKSSGSNDFLELIFNRY